MSRRLLILALAALASFVRISLIAAQELGTPDQAKAMLDRAIAALKSDEPGALSKFNGSPERESPLIIKAAASPITNNDRPSWCGGVLMLAVFLCS